MEHLYKGGRWRNFLAHVAGVEAHDYGDDAEIPKAGYRDPKHPHPTLTVAEAYERFKTEWEKAEDYVSEVYSKLDTSPAPYAFPTRDAPPSSEGFLVEWDRKEIERLNNPQ